MPNELNSKDVPNSDTLVDKSVLNWLSQVIAGKQLPLPPGRNGAKEDGISKDGEAETAATVETLRRIFARMPEPPRPDPVPPSAGRTPANPEESRPETAPAIHEQTATRQEAPPEAFPAHFTAEDLCGAPLVPLIVAAPSSADAITAADVCWVPPGHELHPEPFAAVLAEPEAVPPISEPVESVAANAPTSEPEPVASEATEPETASPKTGEPDHNSVDEALNSIEASTNAASETAPEPAPIAPAGPAPNDVDAVVEAAAVASSPETSAVTGPETSPETSAEATNESAVGPSFEAPALEEQPAATAELSEPIPTRTEPAQPTAESTPEPSSTEAATEQAAAPVESASEVATEAPQPEATLSPAEEQATASTEPAQLAIEAPPELPQAKALAEHATPPVGPADQAVAASAGNSFADGAIWRTATEMAASQNGGIHRATDEAPVPQEKVESIEEVEEEEPFRLEPMEPTETSTSPSESWIEAMKALMRLNPAMPWLANSGAGVGSTATSEIRDQVAGLRLIQYETQSSMRDQAVQLKRMDENLARIREALQSTVDRNLAETVRSTGRAVRMALFGTGITLALVLIMIGMLLTRGH